MTKGINLVDVQKVLDEMLRIGPRGETILCIEIAKRFSTCDTEALDDAISFLLYSQYIGENGTWRHPQSDTEVEQTRVQWQAQSQRGKNRLLRQIESGLKIDSLNQFELGEWVEEAAKHHEIQTVQQLFPLLKRDYFSAERWFELESYFNETQKSIQHLKTEIEHLQQKAEILRNQFRSIEQDIKLKQDSLKMLLGQVSPQSDRKQRRILETDKRPYRTKGKQRFTGIVIHAGEHEGKINSLLHALGILKEGEHGVGSEQGMKLLLRAGYRIEVIEGNHITPAGTVFARLSDLR